MRLATAACLLMIASGATAAPVERSALQRARAAYNQGHFDAAIGAARNAVTIPPDMDAARLVLARALLERYRERADARDLDEARDELRAVDPSHLTQSDRGEWLLGYGQWLFATERYGAAAELFEVASVDEHHSSTTFDATITITESVDRGIELIMTTDGLQDQVAGRHLKRLNR